MTAAMFEKVRIRPTERLRGREGEIGVVVGIGEDEGDGLSYAISLLVSQTVISCWENEIESTGEFVDSSQLYNGDTVRVQVIDGKGKLVD
jgi:hypothetical protein